MNLNALGNTHGNSLVSPRRSFRSTLRWFTYLVGIAVLAALVATPALADWQTGVDAFKSGDYDAAETAFRQLAETQPDWYGGHFMLGRVLVEKGNGSAALASLERALTLEARPEIALLLARTALQEDKASVARDALAGEPPAQLPAAQKLVWLSLRAKAAPDANARLRDLNAAAELAPKDLSVRLSLADAAADAGRLDESARHLEVAKGLSPGDDAVLFRLLKVRLAQSDTAPDSSKAVTCVRSAAAAVELAGVSGKADHLSIAGRSYACAGDLAKAESYFRQALDAESTWSRAYDLAKVQLDEEAWESAETTLRPYLDTEGVGRPKVHLLVGRALEGQQRFLEAIPHYEIAGDQAGIAHAREGQAALDHNKEQEKIKRELEDLQDQIGELEDKEAGLR